MIQALILLLFLNNYTLSSQGLISIEDFKKLNPQERIFYLHSVPFSEMDSASVKNSISDFMDIVTKEGDHHTIIVLLFNHFQERKKMRLSDEEIMSDLHRMQRLARQNHLNVEEQVAHHYKYFEDYHNQRIKHEQIFFNILKEYESFERIGFEKFVDYRIDKLLFHMGSFMYQAEDYQRACTYLLKAENYTKKRLNTGQPYIVILNHIQSIYQKFGELEKAKDYAYKILNFCKENIKEDSIYARYWIGLSQIDLAAILVNQKKYLEGEQFADSGYLYAKAMDWSNTLALNVEYDALMVLIDTKLTLGKLEESKQLLKRAEKIWCATDNQEPQYFKILPFYELQARYYEKIGDYKKAIQFIRHLTPIKDSLDM